MTASRPLRVLIVSTRYLGDCLLAASLVNPIRERYPDAEVDVLTFHRNCGILEGVPGIRRVIGVEERPKKWRQFLDMSAMWNTYDWAIITQQSTRTILYGYFAARRQVVYASANDHRGWWKQKLVTHKVHPYPGHWLDQAEALLEPVLGGRYHIDPSCPDAELPEAFRIRGPYAVFQVCSRYEDKEWSTAGWRALCEKLNARGLRVVIVGGGSSAELERIGRVTEGFAEANVCVAAGKLSFGQTARLIRGARAFVGVDTATSHVAGATGVPVIALFGPTNVTVWGPSPKEGRRGGYASDRARLVQGNVTILRHPDYLACHACDRHRCPKNVPDTLGRCMQDLAWQDVWAELEKNL